MFQGVSRAFLRFSMSFRGCQEVPEAFQGCFRGFQSRVSGSFPRVFQGLRDKTSINKSLNAKSSSPKTLIGSNPQKWIHNRFGIQRFVTYSLHEVSKVFHGVSRGFHSASASFRGVSGVFRSVSRVFKEFQRNSMGLQKTSRGFSCRGVAGTLIEF